MSDREQTEQLIARHLRQRKDNYEALAWLTETPDPSKRSLAEWTNRESARRIREFYARGAREVWAVAFDRNLPYESINTLIITLPDDPPAAPQSSPPQTTSSNSKATTPNPTTANSTSTSGSIDPPAHASTDAHA